MKENKNYRPGPFLPDAIENSKKIRKIKKYHYGFFSNQKVGKGREWVKIKIIVPIRSYPTRNRELKKNSKKNKEN